VTAPATMTDAEAAAALKVGVRTLRPILDEKGLCIRIGRQRRVTARQFEALIAILTPEPAACPSVSSKEVTGITSTARSTVSPSERLLARLAGPSQSKSARS
jgi:hypothetical protein